MLRDMLRKLGGGAATFVRCSDKLLIALCAAASVYGAALVFSALRTAGVATRHFYVQTAAAAVGILLALLLSRIDYRTLCAAWPVWAVAAVGSVILTLTPVGMMVPGTDQQAWIQLGFMTVQPAELMKVAFIVTFARHLHAVRDTLNHPLTLLLLCLHAAVPIGLVFLQRDNGTAIVFVAIFVSMLFCAGIKWLYMLLAGGAAAAAVPFLWMHTSAEKANRLLALIYPEQFLAHEGWQQYLALIAIGSGQMWGVGFLEGGGNGQLYARNNDFLFSVAGEEFGFIGSLAVVALLLLILAATLRNALAARDRLGTYLCAGMASYIGFQSILNLGMNVRLLPVVGVPLPFFSAGGSSVLTLYLGMGLVLSVHFSSRARNPKTIFTKLR